ncbi:hypothetical protein ABMA28_001390 [Loxostege sticticalis]|uniref:FLYWCH-type domain-containing protein n=1 Tax=Loxostege sticticalis TaxID=481309 RepID=A0ABD0T1Q6_LOXSC
MVTTTIQRLKLKYLPIWNLLLKIHFITSKKGYKLLVFEQYTYAQNFRSKNRVSWACSSRCSKKCNAQVRLTNDGELLVLNNEHTHPPPIFYVNEKGEYVRVTDKQMNKMVDEDEDMEYLDLNLEVKCEEEK